MALAALVTIPTVKVSRGCPAITDTALSKINSIEIQTTITQASSSNSTVIISRTASVTMAATLGHNIVMATARIEVISATMIAMPTEGIEQVRNHPCSNAKFLVKLKKDFPKKIFW